MQDMSRPRGLSHLSRTPQFRLLLSPPYKKEKEEGKRTIKRLRTFASGVFMDKSLVPRGRLAPSTAMQSEIP
jgi:hypothetical protein